MFLFRKEGVRKLHQFVYCFKTSLGTMVVDKRHLVIFSRLWLNALTTPPIDLFGYFIQ